MKVYIVTSFNRILHNSKVEGVFRTAKAAEQERKYLLSNPSLMINVEIREITDED